MINLSESSARLLFIHLSELVLGLILFFIFRYFGQLYRRRFLYTWAFSWMAFSLYIFSTGVLAIFFLESRSYLRTGISIMAQLACFGQIIMILKGTHELVSERALRRKKFRVIIVLSVAIAIMSVVSFSQEAADTTLRHLLRMGSRTLMMGLGFLITGIVVWTNRKFSKGFGQRLLAASFIIYSFYQIYYFLVVLLNVFGIQMAIPNFYGVVDLLLIAVMGMSMVMWLLEDEREKLELANQEIDRFLYSTSHDLRAPIASILGLTYLGKIEFQEERARMFMDMVEQRVKKLDSVISDILSLYRSKKIDIKMETLYLGALIEETIADIQFNKGASAISLDYVPDPSHTFRSDYNQMKVILSNLLGNAVKYHNLDQPNPFIRIGFVRTNDGVEISIEDNGQGIPEENLPRIFEMFYRASVNTEGTGLGLYIVSEAVRRIKGTVTVKSAVNKGSTFTIRLYRG